MHVGYSDRVAPTWRGPGSLDSPRAEIKCTPIDLTPSVNGASRPVRDAIFPARRQAGGISTAAAIHNLGVEAMVVSAYGIEHWISGLACSALTCPQEWYTV